MKLTDGSELGISTETIAPPGHALGACPRGMIWFKMIRAVVSAEWHVRQVRQFWIQVPLPQDIEQVKQHLALVRRKDSRVSWMFLYLSELSPLHLDWFTSQDWENVQLWLSSDSLLQRLQAALDLCRRQHEMNSRFAPDESATSDVEVQGDGEAAPAPILGQLLPLTAPAAT